MMLTDSQRLDTLWMQTAVQQFFAEVNWDGTIAADTSVDLKPTSTPPDSSRVDPNAPLPLSLSVSQFLTAVNWDGVALVAVPLESLLSSTASASSAEEESLFTLNDFSDLF